MRRESGNQGSFILTQLPGWPRWAVDKHVLVHPGERPLRGCCPPVFPSLEPAIKLSDTVQAQPHAELKRTLGELWPRTGGHAVCNHHLLLAQGMVKLKKKKKKRQKCMKEIKARHENYFYRQLGLRFEVQWGVMYGDQLGFHT